VATSHVESALPPWRLSSDVCQRGVVAAVRSEARGDRDVAMQIRLVLATDAQMNVDLRVGG